jgi:cation transport ATPase
VSIGSLPEVRWATAATALFAAGLVAFDKTGTLTEGTPRLAAIQVLPGAGLDEQRILVLAASAEQPSEHPLGRAIVTAARTPGCRWSRRPSSARGPDGALRRWPAGTGSRSAVPVPLT